MNAHSASDLAQIQALPLEAKIIMTKQRIKVWYEAWTRFEIFDKKTGKTRFITFDTRDQKDPPMKETEYIVSAFPGWVYVSFSGGKDSTVLKHLVDSMYDDVPSLFVNTGLEYPEIQKFAMAQKNVVTVRPEMRFDEVIRKYGYPVISKEVSQKIYEYRQTPNGYAKDRFDENSDYVKRYGKAFCLARWKWLRDSDIPISHKCCHVMKKKPAKEYEKNSGRMPFIGTLADESRLRKTRWIQNGCNAFAAKRPTSQPLSFWTEQDILHYLKKYNVPYCSVYGDIVLDSGNQDQLSILDLFTDYDPMDKLKTTGCNRTGCVFCMFGITQDSSPNRFQRLKETHPRQYEYCIGGGEFVDGKWQPNKDGLGLGKVLDYIGIDYK